MIIVEKIACIAAITAITSGFTCLIVAENGETDCPTWKVALVALKISLFTFPALGIYAIWGL
jgi:hypothetical protein